MSLSPEKRRELYKQRKESQVPNEVPKTETQVPKVPNNNGTQVPKIAEVPKKERPKWCQGNGAPWCKCGVMIHILDGDALETDEW